MLEVINYKGAVPSNKFPKIMYDFVGVSLAKAEPMNEQDGLSFWVDTDRIETAKYWKEELRLADYCLVCSLTPLSIFEWIGLNDDPFYKKHGLPDCIKDALKSEAEDILRQREKAANERHSQDVFNNQTINAGMGNFSGSSSLDRLGR